MNKQDDNTKAIADDAFCSSKLFKHKVENALIMHIYQQSVLSQLTSLVCATIVFIGLYTTNINTNTLFLWYGFFLFVVASRLILYRGYIVKKDTFSNLRTWKNFLLFSVILGGAAWGLAAIMLFPAATLAQQALIILVIAGVTAGAAPLLAANLVAVFIFLSLALLPLIYQLIIIGTTSTYSLFCVTVMTYYTYLIFLSLKINKLIKDTISLRFRNDSLLDNISLANHQLEISNRNLVEVATHDALTQAANRTLFNSRLKDVIARAERSKKSFALFYLDIDNFKKINDQFGHHIGDVLLAKYVERLQKNVRAVDLVSRLGGDEITIILEDIADVGSIYHLAKLLCLELSMPFVVYGHHLLVTSSIGVSIYPTDGKDTETLLKSADLAMYHVKEHGRNNFHFCQKDFSR